MSFGVISVIITDHPFGTQSHSLNLKERLVNGLELVIRGREWVT